MAAPKFSTSHPKNSPRARKRFTLEQANRSLPLVTRIVRDIVNAHERATTLQAKLEEAPIGKDGVALQRQLEEALESLQEYVDELSGIGVDLKDYEVGLIDFPGQHQGREIYLCWKLGEEKVEFWHEMQTGFAGRQPVSLLAESE